MRPRLDEANRNASGAVSELQTDKVGRSHRKQKQTRTISKKPAFLAAFRVCGSIAGAAQAVGLDRGEHYDWLRLDAGYPAQFEAARIAAQAALHVTALRDAVSTAERAANGVLLRRRKWKAVNLAARERDGSACRICGFAVCVSVHHIVARSKGGLDDLGNLVTLCPNDHALADKGLLTEERLFALIS